LFFEPLTRFRFLCYSDSSLKDARQFYFEEGNDWNVHSLLQAFGNLDAVYEKDGIAKYYARVGLAFSQSIPTIKVCPF
jgi:hypothetical protein